MQYRLKINEDILPMEVKPGDDDKIMVFVKDRKFDVSYAAINDHHVHLVVDGQGVNAYVLEQDGGKIISINGRSYFVQDADLADRTKTRKKGYGSAPTEVTPPMPAVVISIAVSAGDVVKKGQPLVIISAMKMETMLTAPFNGTVKKVNVAEGDKVMPGDILVDIEKIESDEEG